MRSKTTSTEIMHKKMALQLALEALIIKPKM
ncbi:hypothetical protein HNQ90_001868 [Algibacter amylolyticus]|nr:hypothetical protein [Algibacter amylolyticus]